jgi:hypothetical protein
MDYITWLHNNWRESKRYKHSVEIIKNHIQYTQESIAKNRQYLEKLDKTGLPGKFFLDLVEADFKRIEKLDADLGKLERCEVAHWLNLPKNTWGEELFYRLMDHPFNPLKEPPYLDTRDVNTLFRIVEHLSSECFVETSIKRGVYTNWICTMSLSMEPTVDPISVTRIDFDPADCIIRTALTFLDLTWGGYVEIDKHWGKSSLDKIHISLNGVDISGFITGVAIIRRELRGVDDDV